MPQTRSSGPHLGQIVIYTETSTTFYPAIIVAIDSDGRVRLSAFPPGSAMADHDNVGYDESGVKSGSWRYPSTASGI